MRHLFKQWRMRAWQPIDAACYAELYDRFGGSVLSHPITLQTMSTVADIPIEYYAMESKGELIAGLPVWQQWVAGNKLALKKLKRKGWVDLGNAELILPFAPLVKIKLPVQANFISAFLVDNITNLKAEKTSLCLARPLHGEGGLSKKFKYNRRREQRLLQQAGAIVNPVLDYSNDQIADIYINLFEKRWGFKPTGYERLLELLNGMRTMLFGFVIELDGTPIAFQLIFKAECIQHISMEYINGGIDPAYSSLSPGSVLTFINTEQAWGMSEQLGKPLRYSFGKADNEYKDRWCNRSAAYST